MNNKWFENFKTSSNTKIRLFCMPHAGSSADAFKHWEKHLPEWMDLYSLQLPGRGRRFNEPFAENMVAIIDAISSEIIPLLTTPYVFLGHSLGGSIAFELTKKLRLLNHRLPSNLFIIGREGPRIPTYDPKFNASDAEIIEYLKLQSGTDNIIFQVDELLQMLLPIIKSDLKLADTYSDYCQHELALSCPIHAFWGTQENELDQQKIDDWRKESTCFFSVDRFEGNHFFLHEHPKLVISKMLHYINKFSNQANLSRML